MFFKGNVLLSFCTPLKAPRMYFFNWVFMKTHINVSHSTFDAYSFVLEATDIFLLLLLQLLSAKGFYTKPK